MKKLSNVKIGNMAEKWCMDHYMKAFGVGPESVDFKIKASHPCRGYNQDHFGCFDFLINIKTNRTLGVQCKCINTKSGNYSPGKLVEWARIVLNSNFDPKYAYLMTIKHFGKNNFKATNVYNAAEMLGNL